MKFVTIDEGWRLGIVFPTADGGTELVYLTRDFQDPRSYALDSLDHVADQLGAVPPSRLDGSQLPATDDLS